MTLSKYICAVCAFIVYSCSVFAASHTPTYTVSGAVIGLHLDQHVTLLNNGLDSKSMSFNGSFTFDKPIEANGSYEVTVGTQPNQQRCTVLNHRGTNVAGPVNNIRVVCDVKLLRVFSAFGGRGPIAGLVVGPDGYLYGTTSYGGVTDSDNYGTVFKINPRDASYTILHNFSQADGIYPISELALDKEGYFYGTTQAGGANGKGTIFRISSSGSYEVIHSFDASFSGMFLDSNVTIGSDGNLYGVTLSGGSYGKGTIFKLNPKDRLYTLLHSFGEISLDGAYPSAKSVMRERDGYFYGTASEGGYNNKGIIFKISLSGGDYQIMHSFEGLTGGSFPLASLTLGTDGHFYGTTVDGGLASQGTIFKLDPVRSSHSVLHSFVGTEGRYPKAGLTEGKDGYFYGIASQGGKPYNRGAIFKIHPAGGVSDKYMALHFFSGDDAAFPQAGLVLGPDGHFYGASFAGGVDDGGTIFRY